MTYRRVDQALEAAIQQLGEEFPLLNWDFRPDPANGRNERISQWLGAPNEEVMMCAFVGDYIHEEFHRQDFFFINFAYRGNYQALSARYDQQVTVREGDCYIGQPYSGYALRGESEDEKVIVGILIRRDVFLRDFLGALSAAPAMLHFFLEPQVNRFSDEFIHMTLPKDSLIWRLVDLMILEYTHRGDGTQETLKPLALAAVMYLARQLNDTSANADTPIYEQMVAYIEQHLDAVTLADVGARFGYHPNYVSTLLHLQTGRTFSQILLQVRMDRACLLLAMTSLPIERIASMVGYPDTSNFYRAFRRAQGVSPREYRVRAAGQGA
ncbi:MAG: helix-turn-helix transcriptional regulator [Eggerthellaceae bacterium]|jgi:AraC-like DNA-binding protein